MFRLRRIYIIVFWMIFSVPVLLLFASCFQGKQRSSKEEGLEDMTSALLKKEMYERKKIERIDSIYNVLRSKGGTRSPEEKFNIYADLYKEYKLYSFDSAYHYATQLCKMAEEIEDTAYRIGAKTQLGYILARGGFFKEAVDSLLDIRIEKDSLPDAVLSNYYICFGRVYHDLADYAKDDVFSVKYNKLGNELLAQSLPHLSDSTTIYYVRGKIALKANDVDAAKEFYLKALNSCDTNDPETLSVLLSTLAYIDRKLELNDEAIEYYVRAAVNDIHSATKESVALRGLAMMLYYHKNDVNRASEYINEAFENATSYGTRHRINVIGTLLPVFVGEKLDIEMVKRQTFQGSFILSLIFAIVLIVAIVYILIQMRHLRHSRQLLEKLIIKLTEANRIKNSYIGHYLNTTFKLVNQLDNFILVGQQKLESKQYDSLSTMIHNLNSEYNRKSAFADFDLTFLSLFPSFVESFNALLQPTEKIIVNKKTSLNSTLRIFALIRLGITESEQISEILGYSVNTVYNYRVRVRNKAIEPKDFEKNVSKIGL